MNIFKKNIETIDNSKNKDLELVYKSSTGIKFYGFKNFTNIPAVRAIAGERAVRFSDMMVNEALLKTSIKQIKDLFNKGKQVEALSIVNEIDVRLNMFTEEQCLLEISACYFFFKDENINIISESMINDKIKIWKEDQEMKGFFLSQAFRLTKKYSDFSDKDLVDYLKKVENVATRLNNYAVGELNLVNLKTQQTN